MNSLSYSMDCDIFHFICNIYLTFRLASVIIKEEIIQTIS